MNYMILLYIGIATVISEPVEGEKNRNPLSNDEVNGALQCMTCQGKSVMECHAKGYFTVCDPGQMCLTEVRKRNGKIYSGLVFTRNGHINVGDKCWRRLMTNCHHG